MRKYLLFLIAGCLLFASLLACGESSTSGTATNASTPPPTSAPTHVPAPQPLAEHLTFSGDVSGVLLAGDSPGSLTHNNPIPTYIANSDGTYSEPAPASTQCSDFDSGYGQDYVAVIVGNVGTHGRYAITIEINEDDPAYTKPGTPLKPGTTNSGGSVEVYQSALQGKRWLQVYGPNEQDTVIVLHPDRRSGTIDAWLATNDQSQKEATETLHMQGSWRCG